ncbi:AraC family transcriptional regulator [Paludibacterium yongneupense]|uniref:AraC family transcriptional regulator n=1 Tax=Paludibacterium yongneupense TaxID=400061 RepID=UPI000412B50E|nr:nuclear transport factor 2 family protein [Paludibacterium yongneupense]
MTNRPESQPAPGARSDTHEVVLRYHLAWKNRDPDAILALYHPQIAYHDFLQNRVFRHAELAGYVRSALPHGEADRIEHTDRIRVDGDTAFIQYRLILSDGARAVSFCSSEAITVRDGLIWQIREYATLQSRDPLAADGGRSPLQRLGLSARQVGGMVEDLQRYFAEQRPFLDPDCTLQRVAAQTGYSRNQISYLLNQVFGQSFYRYINQARLDYLLARLPHEPPGSRIDSLAFAAGFNSLSAFYRSFRAHTGQSPTAYLRALACGSAGTTDDSAPI